jgi:toxin ParE1/3/4
MNRIYRITPTANQELEDLLQYLATIASFDTSDRFLKRLNQKLTKIAAFPNLGKARPEWGESYRSLPIDNYVIVYRVTEEMVEILRIISGYRDMDDLFTED